MYAGDGDLDLGALIGDAKRIVLTQDRARYVPILRAVENFARKEDLILGGLVGAYSICGISTREMIDADLWTIELYGDNIAQKMRECLLFIWEELGRDADEEGAQRYVGSRDTLILRTVIPDRQYRIVCDYRVVATGYSLGVRKGISIDTQVIDPMNAIGPYSGQELRMMPIIVQVTYICGLLCDPLRAGDRGTNLRILGALFDTGLAQRSRVGARDDPRERLRAEMPRDIEYVVVGEMAIRYYMHTERNPRERPQYLCSFDDIVEWTGMHKYASRYVDIRSPTDARLRKMVIHDQHDAFIADLFNILAFNVVPINRADGSESSSRVVKQGTRIGSPFCVLYFLFLDIWALTFMIKSPQGSNDSAREGMIARVNYLWSLSAKFMSWICDNCAVDVMFPREYAGVYEPPSVALRNVQMSKKINPPMCALDERELNDMRVHIARLVTSI